MDQEMKLQTLSYDPIVKELINLSKEVTDETIKKRLENILELRYQRDAYGADLNSPASPHLQNLLQLTMAENWSDLHEKSTMKYRATPLMVSGFWAGQILKMLVSMQDAHNVLEIGMFTGYGALAMAEALPENGELITCDVEPYLGEMARKHFDKSPHGKKIIIKIAPAMDTLAELSKERKQFDFIFIDADKAGYIGYFQYILDNNLLAPRGTLVFDNVYWSGNPYMVDPDKYEVMREFNDYVKKNDTIFRVLLPVRDGMAVVRRKTDMEYSH